MTSSNWISGEPRKRRVPTIRNNLKPRTIEALETEFESTDTMYNDSIDEEVVVEQDKRNTKIHDILEQMSSIKTSDDGDFLENFTPVSYPEQEGKVVKSILPSDYDSKRRYVTNSNFTADKASDNHSDFNRIYDVSTSKPHYATRIGLGNNTDNSKITDRLSYIVHLLEQQQSEKTNNVLEEYILYILLGTFVIFVVDSFSRGGKYVR